MKVGRPSHGVVVAYLALFVAMSGTAVAATGGTMFLGKTNTATNMTILKNSNGVAMRFMSKGGSAPFSVYGNTTKVSKLNADQLDGLSSGSFQRRVSGSCPTGIQSVAADGVVACAAEQDTGRSDVFVVKSNSDVIAGSALKPIVAGSLPPGSYLLTTDIPWYSSRPNSFTCELRVDGQRIDMRIPADLAYGTDELSGAVESASPLDVDVTCQTVYFGDQDATTQFSNASITALRVGSLTTSTWTEEP
jgi:hypothetical protein